VTASLDSVLERLEALVAFDTQNPPRNLHAGSPLFGYLAEALGQGFDIELTDHGLGRVALLARRGEPQILFNVHLDTVPVLAGSRFPPLELHLDGNRAYGRGACDIKGAAACLLELAATTDAPLALLLTTDEEGGEGCCVAEFIAAGREAGYRQVIVAEPTGCRAESRHRGFLSARGVFHGIGGHSSEARALADNAIHRMARWCAGALALADAADREGRRCCFNIGTVDGGVKSNVIADRAGIFWSARLAPGESNDAFLDRLMALDGGEEADWTVSFAGPPLPTGDRDPQPAEAFARDFGLETGTGLDFWTEASLFGAAGVPALVLGPGHIGQAHAVDEWVETGQLEKALDIYGRLVRNHD